MNLETARALCEMNTRFYTRVSTSFSATRQAPWNGWLRVLAATGCKAGDSINVLDLACGNLRFERYLAQAGIAANVCAVDNCNDLVELGKRDDWASRDLCAVTYQHLDIMDELLSGRNLAKRLTASACDLSVSFGFMHHVPLREYRERVLHALVDATRLGGTIAVSFWQFAKDERLARKARSVEDGDEGDFLLGWQGEPGVYRYCHSFSEAEIDQLVESCGHTVCELSRFVSDGKSGVLNQYLLLRKCSATTCS